MDVNKIILLIIAILISISNINCIFNGYNNTNKNIEEVTVKLIAKN